MGQHFDVLGSLIRAWQADDIDGVLAHLADDIVWHFAAPALPPIRGKAAAGKLLRRLQADMTGMQWRIFGYAESGDHLFVEGVDEHTTAEGRRVATPYAGVLDFRDGLIIGWRDYVDLGVMAAQKSGEPLGPVVEDLINRPVVA